MDSNMDDDDPYELLGVSRDATPSQIRAAYRKAALQHHPDRVQDEKDKATANVLFSKISNAYELLSDEQQRAAFDAQQYGMPQSHPHQSPHHQSPFHGFHNGAGFQFHDPFEVFRHVFREEFGGGGGPSFRNHQQQPFAEADQQFFHNDPFAHDPFFSSVSSPFSVRSSRGPSLFGGGTVLDRFDDMFDSMEQHRRGGSRSSMRDSDSMFSSSGLGSSMGMGSSGNMNYSFTSTSSSTSFGGQGQSITTQTTRKMVNGKEEVVTERIVRNPDGTVERTVQNHNNNNPQRIEEEVPQQQQQPAGYLPWRRPSRSSSSRRGPPAS